MYLTLYKDGKRITSLVVTVHGDNMDDVKAYASANYEYDEAKEQTEQEHFNMIEAESKQAEETETERKGDKLEAEAKALENALKELKEEYVLADMQGDEETKEAIKQEYMELLGANNEL